MKYKTIFKYLFFIVSIAILISPLLRAENQKANTVDLIIKGSTKKNGEFSNPAGIVVGKNGEIYAVDSLNARVQVFNEKGEFLYYIGQRGMGDGEFAIPWGVALDREGHLFVTDIGQHKVYVFDIKEKKGNFLTQFGGNGPGRGKFNMPFDITIDEDGYIYVLDTGNNLVQVIKGRFLFQFGSYGRKEGEFINPTGIEVGKDGYIYIVDTGNSRVQVFTRKGLFIKKFGGAGSREGDFSKPEGITLDKDRNIYVADGGNNRIQVFNNDGKIMFEFGNLGKNSGQFDNPGGMDFFKNKLYVVDTRNNRIQIFRNLFQTYARCYFCHEEKEKLLKTAEVIHPPFKDECEECHKRHLGTEEGLIIASDAGFIASGNELCYKCHKPTTEEFIKSHKEYPVTKTECIGCHSPHATSTPKLIIGHAAVKKLKCTTCHEKDGDKVGFVEKKEVLCYTCHAVNLDSPHNINRVTPEIKQKLEKVVKNINNECAVCHRLHGSSSEFNLIESGNRICYLCHDPEKITHQHIIDMYPSEKVNVSYDLPLGRTGKVVCYTCHNAHSNRNKPYLHFPKGEMCVKCHGGYEEK
ncbi:MAG: 6-bladed beta-propeller [Candidatus Firestonebacteria bacterium]|nr:6-bladed beta-propeller [Candidatus Firestonebacteria bacterium]